MILPRFLSTATAILGAGLIAVTAAGYGLVPAGTILPVHWGLDGAADGWMPRDLALLVLVAIAALIWALFYALDRFAPRFRAEGGRYALRAVLTAITGLVVLIQCGIVAAGMGLEVDMVRIVTLGIGVLLVILGNIMPKTQPNAFAGIRIPTTLNDPANWQATHRLTGWLLIAAGLCLLIAGMVVAPGPWLLGAIVVAMLLPLVIGTVYSLRLARRRSA